METVAYSSLNQTHPDYDYYREVWETIADIKGGSSVLKTKAAKYLPKKAGERQDAYNARLAKFSFTPVMSNAIREFSAKLASGQVHIEGAEGDFWDEWKEHTDGRNQDQEELIQRIFSCLLYYKRVYLAVDRDTSVVRSALEAEGSKPYVILFEPLQVRNWGEDWYMSRQILDVTDPFKAAKKVVRFTLWAKDAVSVYEAECKLGKDLEPEQILVGEKWRSVNFKDCLVPLKTKVAHSLGASPMVMAELPTELWTGNQTYLKQLQHTRIESSLTEAGSVAGTIQRVYTPPALPPLDDPRVTYETPDYSEIKSDNSHILIGAGFKFEESSGSAIHSLIELMNHIEDQIADLVNLKRTNTASKVAQTAESKSLDKQSLNDAMKAYGQKVTQVYQDLLELVAKASGLPSEIRVSGLDNYSNDSLEEALNFTEQIVTTMDFLSPVAVKLWFVKLQTLMHPSVSPTTAKEMEDTIPDPKEVASQIDGMAAQSDPNSDQGSQGIDLKNPDDIKWLMDQLKG